MIKIKNEIKNEINELNKAIKTNPELEVKIFSENNCEDDDNYYEKNIMSVKVQEIWLINETYFFEEDNAIDNYILESNIDFTNISDEEIEKELKKYCETVICVFLS